MLNYEEKIRILNSLLSTGEIDEITYKKELDKLLQKSKKRNNFKKNDFFSLLKICIKIILIFALLIWIYRSINVKKNIEYVNSLNNIQQPRQISTSGKVNKIIGNSKVEITYVAKYNISGRVVDVQNYYGYNLGNKLSPKDIGICWGPLANKENYEKIKFFSFGDRFINSFISDNAWLSEMGGINKISEYFSNNHLIPSDDKIEKLLKSIKKGDFIKIEGYLVNVYSKTSNGGYFTWNTSTSRKDKGSGACELLYVTDIAWIKERK